MVLGQSSSAFFKRGFAAAARSLGALAGDAALVDVDGRLRFGSSAVRKSDPVTLTSAEIKALPGTDVELVAAPGAGKMIVPQAAYLVSDFASAYSGIDANTEYPAIWVSHTTRPIYLAELIDDPDGPQSLLTTFLTGTNEFGPVFYTLLPRQHVSSDGPASQYVGVFSSGGPADYDDVSLKLGADNSINFTGGDAANTLTVTVLYTVLDV